MCRVVALSAAMVTLVLSPSAWGEWEAPTPVPVDRLIENAKKYVEENPKDARGYYVLGRLHSLAFAVRKETIRVYGADKPLPQFPHWESILVPVKDAGSLEKKVLDHLTASVRHYRKAVELDPEKAYYRLGLAWMLEQGRAWAVQAGVAPELKGPDLTEEERRRWEEEVKRLGAEEPAVRDQAEAELRKNWERSMRVLLRAREHEDPEVRARIEGLISWAVRRQWTEEALGQYRKAFELTEEADRRLRSREFEADWAISLEAAQGIVRILKERGPTEEEKKEIERLTDHIWAMERITEVMVTPIVFPIREPLPLRDLVDASARVRFDLHGLGIPAEWPWLRANAAFLAWDWTGSGKIESGRQLFGSVTWLFFWEHGY